MLDTAAQIARVRSAVDEPVEAIATDVEIAAWLVDADIGIIAAIRERSPEKLQENYALTTVAGQETYALPSDFHKVVYIANAEGTAVYANPFTDGVSVFAGKFQVKPVPTIADEYRVTYLINAFSLVSDYIPLAKIAYAIAWFFKKDRQFTIAQGYMAEYEDLIGKVVKDVCTSAARRCVFDIESRAINFTGY
ncbi:MAG: hypothetical protein WC616_05985 [Candidatus Omnitrophota bacterium]